MMMTYLRRACGAILIFSGFALQVLAWLVHEAGWRIESAGCRIWERPCPPRATPPV